MSGVRPTASRPVEQTSAEASSAEVSSAERALVIGTIPLRAKVLTRLREAGVVPAQADNAYAAMAELCRRPTLYRAVVVSLQGLYREELQIIPSVKRANRQIKVWVTDLEGRPAALAEAMRLGADGLLGEDGLHRLDDAEGEEEIPPPAPPPVADVWEDDSTPAPATVGKAMPAAGDRTTYVPAFGAATRRMARGDVPVDRPAERQPVRVTEREANRPAVVASKAAAGQVAAATPVAPAADPSALLGDVEGNRRDADEPVLSAAELRALLHDPTGDGF